MYYFKKTDLNSISLIWTYSSSEESSAEFYTNNMPSRQPSGRQPEK